MESTKKNIGFLFVALTYIITWSVEIPAALNKYGYAIINVSKGLQTICTLSPGIVAVLLTLIFFKKPGLKYLLKAIIKWRIKFKWYFIVAILGIALCGLSLLLFNWIYAQINNPAPAYIFYFILY